MLSFAMPLLALAVAAAGSPPPSQAPGIVPPVGGSARYHVVRTLQDASGAKTIVSDVVLRRKAATTATLEGSVAGQSVDLTVLNVGRDGTLYIPKNDKSANQDAAMVDVVSGLNRLTELFAGENGAPRDGWSATLSLPEIHGASAPVELPIAVANLSAGDFDLRGDGQYAPPQPAQSGAQRGGGRHGMRGSLGGGRGADADAPGEPGLGSVLHLPYGVALTVVAQVRRGALRTATITETRTVTVETLPFTNVGAWTIEAVR